MAATDSESKQRSLKSTEFWESPWSLETATTIKASPAKVPVKGNLLQRFIAWVQGNLETQGVEPTPESKRVDKRLYHLFFLFFACNFNLVAFSQGTAGPIIFGLGLRDSLLIILLANLIFAAVPAYMSIFGPKLGLRGMILARFSWGYYGAKIPSVLTMFSEQGFVILNAVVGSQILGTVSHKLHRSVCIGLMGFMTLLVTLFGCNVVHMFETFAWIPNVASFVFMIIINRKELQLAADFHVQAPSLAAIVSFFSLTATWFICYPNTADYGIFHDHKASSFKIFLYVYLGFIIGSAPFQMLGACFAAAIPAIPSWSIVFQENNLGSLIAVILEPIGIYGKILAVIMSVALISGSAPSMYSFCTCAMAVSESSSRISQYWFPPISTAILIPFGILGTEHFYETLVNIFAFVGYWIASYTGIIVIDHAVIRMSRYDTYNTQDFNRPSQLPSCIPALCAFFGSFIVTVPCISQAWFVGPLAKMGVGDLGIFSGMAGAGLIYIPLRLWWNKSEKESKKESEKELEKESEEESDEES